MAALPAAGENVFDLQGTVLYRVVSEQDYAAEMQSMAAASASPQPVQMVGGLAASYSVGVAQPAMTSHSQSGRGAAPAAGGTKAASLLSSTAQRGGARTYGAAIAARAAASGVDGSRAADSSVESLPAARLSLEKIFPPVRLNAEGEEIGSAAAADSSGPGESAAMEILREERSSSLSHSSAVSVSAKADSSTRRKGQASVPGVASDMIDSVASVRALEKTPGAVDRSADTHWLKVAALDHTSRVDVILLKNHIEARCRDEHARPRGTLCPIREAIYNDAMHEITRQLCMSCPERGELLAELCEHVDLTVGTYDVLFDSACQYAMRKSTERDLRQHLFEEKAELQSNVRRCENRVLELRAKLAGVQAQFAEQQAATARQQEAEVQYLKGANQQITAEIKRFLSAAESAKTADAAH